MNKEQIYTYLEHSEALNNTSTDELRHLVEAYPYFQTARLLYTQHLHATKDEQFNKELGRTAIFCADRDKLFYLIHAERYEQLLKQPGDEALSETDRTEVLLDSYLRSFEESEPKESEPNKPAITGGDHAASLDYFAYLESMGEELDENSAQRQTFQHQDIIDAFLQKADDDQIRPAPADEWKASSQATQEDPDGEFLTETLAKIYIKQKKYEQALTIIKRLSLNFPKKSAYFADQIRFLEYLIINEKTKK